MCSIFRYPLYICECTWLCLAILCNWKEWTKIFHVALRDQVKDFVNIVVLLLSSTPSIAAAAAAAAVESSGSCLPPSTLIPFAGSSASLVTVHFNRCIQLSFHSVCCVCVCEWVSVYSFFLCCFQALPFDSLSLCVCVWVFLLQHFVLAEILIRINSIYSVYTVHSLKAIKIS